MSVRDGEAVSGRSGLSSVAAKNGLEKVEYPGVYSILLLANGSPCCFRLLLAAAVALLTRGRIHTLDLKFISVQIHESRHGIRDSLEQPIEAIGLAIVPHSSARYFESTLNSD